MCQCGVMRPYFILYIPLFCSFSYYFTTFYSVYICRCQYGNHKQFIKELFC